ncbi:hypothetical protein [Pararhodospirillum oryzae]|uniref:DUF3168 domain-containing protein n=1 Tax=Pararhodospirillum oryzae TaxID=478448 RepID=A0A512H4X7_9PROT|nr:hypothetical protein [Pararhodospirillum oryzae]GEO80440.1 hypothetical protein ROR02_05710 [Pararhodospirillum oryzae]
MSAATVRAVLTRAVAGLGLRPLVDESPLARPPAGVPWMRLVLLPEQTEAGDDWEAWHGRLRLILHDPLTSALESAEATADALADALANRRLDTNGLALVTGPLARAGLVVEGSFRQLSLELSYHALGPRE